MLDVVDLVQAADRFEFPGDRIGVIVMISTENMTIGTTRDRHDLAALNEPPRSHGGLTEQVVPFVCDRVLDLPDARLLRNFKAVFDAAQVAALDRTRLDPAAPWGGLARRHAHWW